MKTFLQISFFLLFVTQICFAQWVQTNFPYSGSVSCLAVSGNNIFAGTYGGGVFLTTNNGTSWTQVNNGLTSPTVNCFAVSGINIFAGTSGGVYLSTNNGANWTQVNSSLTNTNIRALVVSGSNIYAGIESVIYLSANSGTSWTQITDDLPNTVLSIAVSGTNIFAGTYSGLFHSTKNGKTWTKTDLTAQVRTLAINGNNIYALNFVFRSYPKVIGPHNISDVDGVYLSTNNGTSWTQILPMYNLSTLFISGTNIFAISGFRLDYPYAASGVFLSTNNGANWAQVNDGLPDSIYIYSLTVCGPNIFAGTDRAGIWRRPLSELVGITKEITELPKQYTLSQNYPNPYNPSTNIKYSIPKSSQVSVKVYDLLGNEIKTLVNEEKPAGTYESIFNSANLAGGVYFYRIQAGSFIETKKMILLK